MEARNTPNIFLVLLGSKNNSSCYTHEGLCEGGLCSSTIVSQPWVSQVKNQRQEHWRVPCHSLFSDKGSHVSGAIGAIAETSSNHHHIVIEVCMFVRRRRSTVSVAVSGCRSKSERFFGLSSMPPSRECRQEVLCQWFLQWITMHPDHTLCKVECTIETCKIILQYCGHFGSTNVCAEVFTCLLRAQVAFHMRCTENQTVTFDARICSSSAGLPSCIKPLCSLRGSPYVGALRANLSFAIDLCETWLVQSSEKEVRDLFLQLSCFWQDVHFIVLSD